MLVLTISGKNYSQEVSTPIKKYLIDNKVNKDLTIKESGHFLADRIMKEVTDGENFQVKQKIEKLKKIQKGFVLILSQAMILSPITIFAQENQEQEEVKTQILQQSEISPALVMSWGMKIALITVAIGVAISGALLATAGVYRMFRKRTEATEWTVDIIKGLVQVLIAIPTVYALFHLAQTIFKNIPALENLL